MLKEFLEFSWAYELSQNVFGLPRMRSAFINEYVKPAAGMRILDAGCGPRVIVPYLKKIGNIDYTGIDSNPEYIRKAGQRYSDAHYNFRCADVSAIQSMGTGEFDIVIMIGVLHHLDDGQAGGCMQSIAKLLKNNGRFCSFDGVYDEKVSRVERLVLQNDRGKYVRTPGAYAAIVNKYIPGAKYEILRRMLNIPAPVIIFY
jgi:SAM-dependent methyltransferase